jgi:hypothetical protein
MTSTTSRSPREYRSLVARLRNHRDRHHPLPPKGHPSREDAPDVCQAPGCSTPLDNSTGRPKRCCSAACRARLSMARQAQERPYCAADYHSPLTVSQEAQLRARIVAAVTARLADGRGMRCVWCGDYPYEAGSSYCSAACARAFQRWRKDGTVTIAQDVREDEESHLREERLVAFREAFAAEVRRDGR